MIDPGTPSVTDPVMVLWRDDAMTTTHRPHGDAGTPDVVQLGLFGSVGIEPWRLVHPRQRAFAVLLARAPADEDAALEVLTALEPELRVLARRLVRFGRELDVARGDRAFGGMGGGGRASAWARCSRPRRAWSRWSGRTCVASSGSDATAGSSWSP